MLTDDLAARILSGSTIGPKPLVEIEVNAQSGEQIVVPDASLMFQGEYHKAGFDLVIENGTTRFTIHDYFRVDKRPGLVSAGGATLGEEVVSALAISEGGVRYAQAAPAAAPAAIGRVETVTGQATAIRNGTPVALAQGALVYKGDVVETDRGSSLGITFIDGTTFSLSASARMVLNDMVYQPGGQQNSALLNIVQGSVTFLAGQVAKTGDMKVGTPVATMGIRGTLVRTEVSAEDGVVRFSVLTEPNGQTGRYDLIRDGRVVATVSDSGTVFTVSPSGIISTAPKTFAEQQADQLLVQQIFQIVSLAQANPLLPLPGPAAPGPGGPGGGGGGGSSTDPNINGSTSPFGGSNGNGNGGNVDPGGTNVQPPLAGDFRPVTNTAATSPVATIGGGPAQAGQTSAGQTSVGQTPNESPTGPEPTPAAPVVILARSGGAAEAGQDVVVQPDGAATVAGTYGSFVIRSDGTYSYVPLRTQQLAAGERGDDTFTYTVQDANGQRSTTTVAFDNVGVNDQPRVAGPQRFPASAEGGSASSRNLLEGASDPDNGETATLTVANVTYAVDGGQASPTAPSGLALSGTTLTIDPSNPAFDPLPAGVTQRIVVSYDVVDAQGATVRQTSLVEITGTNDGPRVSGPQRAAANEGAAAFTSNLLVGASDPDDGETGTLKVANVAFAVDGGSASPNAPSGVTLSGTTLTVDPSHPAFDHLPVGVAQRIAVSYDVVDAQGATIRQTSLVEITGTNDAPRVSGPQSATAKKGTAAFTTDLLAGASDPDDGETSTLKVANVTYAVDGKQASSTAPNGVTLSGTTLTVDPSHPAFNLPFGASQRILVSYDVVDALGASVRQTSLVEITGTNRAPVVSGPQKASANEGAAAFTSDLLAGASDPDEGETATLKVANVTYAVDGGSASSAPPKGVTLSGATLTVDPSDPAFDHLPAGVKQSILVSFDVVDIHGASVPQTSVIEITGTNDAPRVSGPQSATASKGSATFTSNLLAGASDPDDGETGTLKVTGVTYAVDGGQASSTAPNGVSLAGTTLTVDPSNPAFDDLSQGTTRRILVSYDIADAHGASVRQTSLVEITGTKQGPTISAGVPSNELREQNLDANFAEFPSSATVQLTRGDGQAQATYDLTGWTAASDRGPGVYSKAGIYGTAYLDTGADRLTYQLDNTRPATEALNTGDVRQDAFTVGVTDGTRSAAANVSFKVNGTTDGFDGSFETGFAGWQRIGNASVVAGGTDGSHEARLITSSDQTYTAIETFLGLPAGTLASDPSQTNTSNDATVGSAIKTTGGIRLEAGQSLTFDWNFRTSDYSPYNDFAFFSVDELDKAFELADVESVGDYGSTGPRTYTFTATQSGDYHFGFGVLDTGDGIVSSTLEIDNVRVGTAGAMNDTATVNQNSGPTPIDVLANDTGPNGGPKSIASVAQPVNGTVAITSGGTGLTYTPKPNYFGQDSFIYTLNGGSTASVSVTVVADNDPPTIDASTSGNSASAGLTESNTPLVASGTLTAKDPDGTDSVTVSVVQATHTGQAGGLTDQDFLSYFKVPSGAIVTQPATSGQFTWTFDSKTNAFDYLAAGENLALSYRIRPNDGHGVTQSGDRIVTITVTGTNDAPVGVADEVRVLGANATIPDEALLFNDTDVDNGAMLSVASGSVSGASYGSNNFFASGAFSFSVQDANGASATEAVSFVRETANLTASSTGSVLIAPASGSAILTGNVGRDVFVVQQASIDHPELELVGYSSEDAIDLAFLKDNASVTPANIGSYVRLYNGNLEYDADGTGAAQSWVVQAQATDVHYGEPVAVIWHQQAALIYATWV